LNGRTLNLTIGPIKRTRWIVKVKIEGEPQGARTIDAVHTSIDQGTSVCRKQRFIVGTLEMCFIPWMIESLAEISEVEFVVYVGCNSLNQHQVLEVFSGCLVGTSDLPLFPIYTFRNLRFVDAQNNDGRVGHTILDWIIVGWRRRAGNRSSVTLSMAEIT
jgi:hypothetical protein